MYYLYKMVTWWWHVQKRNMSPLTFSIGACANNPCFHGGQCRGAASTFECVCGDFSSGSRCEALQTTCGLSPCTTGSICRTLDNSLSNYTCHCPRGMLVLPQCSTSWNACQELWPNLCRNLTSHDFATNSSEKCSNFLKVFLTKNCKVWLIILNFSANRLNDSILGCCSRWPIND